MTKKKHTPAYPAELRERGVRLFRENRSEYTSDNAAYRAIAPKLGCSPDSLRVWCQQAERDRGRNAPARALCHVRNLGHRADGQGRLAKSSPCPWHAPNRPAQTTSCRRAGLVGRQFARFERFKASFRIPEKMPSPNALKSSDSGSARWFRFFGMRFRVSFPIR